MTPTSGPAFSYNLTAGATSHPTTLPRNAARAPLPLIETLATTHSELDKTRH
jgi:hypothetical protein